jgi:UDPglucose 6-dehydrogenase
LGKKGGTKTTLLDAIISVNNNQNRAIVNKLRLIFGRVKGLRVGVLGLTYKAGTSTLRRSASIEIIKELIQKGASVKAYDPKADPVTKVPSASFKRCNDADSVADSSDALLLLTGWPEFKELDFVKLKSKMSHPIIIDALNMLDAELMAKHGFIYVGMGRGNKAKAINDIQYLNTSKQA